MRRKPLLSVSIISLLVLSALTCVSCAHEPSTQSIALNSGETNEQHIWAERRYYGEE